MLYEGLSLVPWSKREELVFKWVGDEYMYSYTHYKGRLSNDSRVLTYTHQHKDLTMPGRMTR